VTNQTAYQVSRQEAQLSLTNRPTLEHADVPCFAVKSCPLVNDCDLLAVFSDLYLPLSHVTPSMTKILSSYRDHIRCGKTRMAGLQSGEGCKMIHSVVRAQYINVTDTQTDSHVAIENAALAHCICRHKSHCTKCILQSLFNTTTDENTRLLKNGCRWS